MPYVILTTDRPGVAELRAKVRPAHVEYLKAHQHLLLAAGATLEDDGITATGTLYVVDTDDRAMAERFAREDPFAAAGVFAQTSVIRWRKAFFGFENTMPPDWDKVAPPARSAPT